jgi:two-component system, LytTR family, sensor kinase
MRIVTKEKTTRIIIHILVGIVILGLPIYTARRFRMESYFLYNYYSFMAVNALIFYTNYLFLVPGLFFQKKRYRYYVAVLALVFCFYFISDFASNQVYNYISKNENTEQFKSGNPERLNRSSDERLGTGPPQRETTRPRVIIAVPNARIIGYASSSLIMVFFSLGLRLLERQSQIGKMQEEMEKAKLNAELALLKNQISPHFFFNTLNNIYSLIGRNNEDSKNAVIKLSRLMRYVLNESGQENKPLSDEIEFMNNYIDLMKLRIGSKTRLNVNFPTRYKDLMIPHLLFVSLIENAFKYGISVQEESYVNISLECTENKILFKCENGLPESNTRTIFASSGIGLENLKKRLSLLYPEMHELEINRTRNKFEADLIIHL